MEEGLRNVLIVVLLLPYAKSDVRGMPYEEYSVYGKSLYNIV